MSVQDTLRNRTSIYGNYKGNIEARIEILQVLKDVHKRNTGNEIKTIHLEYLHDLIVKLTRCATDMYHTDNWHDIAGYALLIEEAVKDD